MRRKNLLTAVLCAVLVAASCAVSDYNDTCILHMNFAQKVYAAEETQKDLPAAAVSEEAQPEEKASGAAKTSETTGSIVAETTPETTKPTESSAPETTAPAPETTKPTETTAPETTTPTEGPAPETTKPTETTGPAEGSSGTEQHPSETGSGTEQTSAESSSGTEQIPTETIPDTGTDSGTEQLPSETAPGTEQPSTEQMTGTEQLPAETTPDSDKNQSETMVTETSSESETESEAASETESELESESESETSEFDNNEDLIANQNIVVPPEIELEFRFTQVDKAYAVVSRREGTAVYEEKSENAREVGVLEYYGSCYILENRNDGWYYVESGNVRGFVKADVVVTGEVAERIVKVKGLEELPEARLLVARTENEAFDYIHTTVHEVMAEKVYAIADGQVTIYEQRKDSARGTGTLSDGALCYILADEDADWMFVESGNARGFVEKRDLITGSEAKQIVAERGEKNMAKAEVLVEPEDNKSCYYTLTSVQAASQSAKTREAMVNFALQFVGNPYVWGGTSLTNGADCSGFVQSIYSYFGYSIPRVAEDQSRYGMQIPISSAQPGDLIFYARNGYVYHVSMYIGDGRVVQAANRRAGIITSGIGEAAVWATRIITD